jgi:hypothetical protein
MVKNIGFLFFLGQPPVIDVNQVSGVIASLHVGHDTEDLHL